MNVTNVISMTNVANVIKQTDASAAAVRRQRAIGVALLMTACGLCAPVPVLAQDKASAPPTAAAACQDRIALAEGPRGALDDCWELPDMVACVARSTGRLVATGQIAPSDKRFLQRCVSLADEARRQAQAKD